MTKITENAIEKFCIELLEKQGYETIYAPALPQTLTTRYGVVLKTFYIQSLEQCRRPNQPDDST